MFLEALLLFLVWMPGLAIRVSPGEEVYAYIGSFFAVLVLILGTIAIWSY